MATTIPAEFHDLLESKALANIATVGPKGEPQNSPVWFEWDGSHILFSQAKGRQKLHNLQREPRIAISIVDPSNPYRYLEIRGKVVRIDEDPEKKFINKMAKKYINQDVYPYNQPSDERVIIVVEPEKVPGRRYTPTK